MISVVAYSLLEEIPPDLKFFIRIHGWSELLLMFLIFVSTIFWNLKIGIAVGIGLSLLHVVRHATRPRIQILGRVRGTTDRFENAEHRGAAGQHAPPLEFFEGCLIVKIPEPLTFANTGSLRSRLTRLEEHGPGPVDEPAADEHAEPGAPAAAGHVRHPANPPVRRKENNKNIIFDIHGVTSLDAAGAQVLRDIVAGYVRRGVRVIFCRCPKEGTSVWRLLEASGVVELCGGRDMLVESVADALRLTEAEGTGARIEDEERGP
jgi:MFS superfamily sulfate permease-like transporter